MSARCARLADRDAPDTTGRIARRRALAWLLVASLAATVVLSAALWAAGALAVGLAEWRPMPTASRGPGSWTSGTTRPAPGVTLAGLERVTVTRVVDGDTIHVRMPDGADETIRFIGVNTPESTTRHEPYGEEASAYTKRALAGRVLWLEFDSRLRDRYGRVLAYVSLEPPADRSAAEVRAKMFNARLLLEGYAQLMTIPPDVRYVDTFTPLQAEARSAGTGLWALPGN
jgi:micrococcal nuclease